MKRILVIDDEPGILHLLRTLLKDEGYEVLAASNGQGALQILEDEDIDVILLDLMMPQMSGWDFLDELQARPETERPKVAILSAVFKDDAIERAHTEFGAKAYITKPFQIQDLIDTLDGILA